MSIRLVAVDGKILPGVKLPPIPASPARPANVEIDADVANPAPDVPRALPLLLSIKDAVRELGVCKTKIFTLVNQGRLERIRIDGRTFITSDSVLALARPSKPPAGNNAQS